MIDNIIEPTMDYDFSNIFLGPPTTVPGGSYFTRILYKNNKPLYVQTPKCFTKQGFIKNGKKVYADLMFDNNDNIFISWIENLESKCQDLIYVKGESWFQTKLEKDDIETAFTSPFKIYKSGKNYLLRVNVKPNIKIYSETDSIINLEDVSQEKPLISILEIQGIKFTSRNFQIEIELKQSMVVSPDPFLDSCFIKRSDKPQIPAQKISNESVEIVPEIEDNMNTVIHVNTNKHALETMKNEPYNLTITPDKSQPQKPNGASNTNTNKNENEEPSKQNPNHKNNDILSLEEITDFVFDDEDDKKQEQERKTTEKEKEKETKPNEKKESNMEFGEENITLEIEDLNPTVKKEIEDPNALKEMELLGDSLENLEPMTLKQPNQVYYEIYQKARERAKQAKQAAILAYLEVKNIKKTYMLDDINESDDEDFSMNELIEN
jgi:hypothetical protein